MLRHPERDTTSLPVRPERYILVPERARGISAPPLDTSLQTKQWDRGRWQTYCQGEGIRGRWAGGALHEPRLPPGKLTASSVSSRSSFAPQLMSQAVFYPIVVE